MNDDEVQSLLAGLNPPPLTLCQQGLADAATLLAPPGEGKFFKYRYDALGYFVDVLKARFLSDAQENLLRLISQPANDEWHRKIAVGASVNYGKSFSGGGITNWYYDAWGPCIVATTAPSQQSVVDLLWKEVRLQRGRADSKWGIGPQDFIGPQAPAMRRAPDWWAKGYVAAKGENFKGRHVDNMCFIFDESVGLDGMYFRMTKGMFKANTSHLWICFYNPTNTASAMYQEIIRPDSDWTVVELSALGHPNIKAALAGQPLPIPAAISKEQVEDGIKDDCEPVDVADKQAVDFEWPPGSGNWFHPGPSFEGDYLGRWPTEDDAVLWSDALWKAVSEPLVWKDAIIPVEELPRIGCDVAYLGAAKTCTNIVWGDYSVFHESKGRQQPMRTVGRLVELAEEWAERVNKSRVKSDCPIATGKQIPIKIDDTGIGGGCTSRLRELGYNVFPVGAAEKAMNQNKYPNKRSELWFMTRERARTGRLKLGLLPYKALMEIRRQLMAPTWVLTSDGRREIERKEQTEARLGRSPDDADSLNLANYVLDFRTPEVMKIEQAGFLDRAKESREQRSGATWRAKVGRRGIFRR